MKRAMNDIKKVAAHYNDSGNLIYVAVAWTDNLGYRATYFDLKVKAGFGYLKPGVGLTDKLVKEVRDYGCYLSEKEANNLFPDLKKWSN